eukprot:scaffold148589_cov13-Prasinocladus_malaysianus.AAC.1
MELAARFKHLKNNASAKNKDATTCCSHELGCHIGDEHTQPTQRPRQLRNLSPKTARVATTGCELWLNVGEETD